MNTAAIEQGQRTDAELLARLRAGGAQTVADLARALEWPLSRVRNSVERLEKREVVYTDGFRRPHHGGRTSTLVRLKGASSGVVRGHQLEGDVEGAKQRRKNAAKQTSLERKREAGLEALLDDAVKDLRSRMGDSRLRGETVEGQVTSGTEQEFLARLRVMQDAKRAGDFPAMADALKDMAASCLRWGVRVEAAESEDPVGPTRVRPNLGPGPLKPPPRLTEADVRRIVREELRIAAENAERELMAA